MNVDLIGSVDLTASAAIVIAALSIGFGSSVAMRVRIAVGLAAWFVLVVILAATRALYYEHGLGTPGLGMAVVLPIVILCLLAARRNSLGETFRRVPVWLLVGVHTVSCAWHQFRNSLLDRTSACALRSDCWLGRHFRRRNRAAGGVVCLSTGHNTRPIVWLWNSIGTVDLIAAVGLGVTSSPGPLRLIFSEPSSAIMTTLPWLLIPGFLVPLLIAVHIGIFIRLAKDKTPALEGPVAI